MRSIKEASVPLGYQTRFSYVNLQKDASVSPERWSSIPAEQEIVATIAAIEGNNIRVIRVKDGAVALLKIKEMIPPGAEVMSGSSTTLIEIGFEDFMRSQKGWKNLRAAIASESNGELRNDLRRRSVTAEYFLSGVNAIAKTGHLVGCDSSGSRVGAWLFGAKNLILASGVNKIVPTLQDALERIRDYVYPLENGS
jgi:hypothetical protein